jgi:flagellar hook-basal body complex protein FliE
MPIPIAPVSGVSVPAAPALEPRASNGGFQSVFADAIKSVEGSRQTASASVEQFLSGEGGELHSTILATQKAELSFDLFLQMRNKVVSAYQEIMRMQM